MRAVVEIKEGQRDTWDAELKRFEMAHPLNAYGWSQVRAIDGWSPVHLLVKENGRTTGAASILIKRIPVIGLSVMYSPRGFVFDLADTETLKELLTRIRSKAKEERTIFLRIDPHVTEEAMSGYDDPFIAEGFQHLPCRSTYWNAPSDVCRVDLAKGNGAEELFATIDAKARTGIRKAKKEGVIIRPAENKNELEKFYAIYREFAVAKQFLVRGFSYQESLWNEFISKGQGVLLLSVYHDQIVGGQICLSFGGLCVEMHRGVLQSHQKLRINEALVWQGMLWAKERGCRWYCQRGVGGGPLQKFKNKFRPKLVSLVGYYDLSFSPRLYRVVSFVEFKVLPFAVNLLMLGRRRFGSLFRSG